MKKLLSFILIFVIMLTVMPTSIFTFTASAATTSGTYGYFSYVVSDGEATVWVDDKASIKGSIIVPFSVGNNYPVTGIGIDAFKDCSGITQIAIHDKITHIGMGAFSGCTGLKSVYVEDLAKWCQIEFQDSYSNPLYYGKHLYLSDDLYYLYQPVTGTLITDLQIPKNIEKIGKYAFFGCQSITSVTIPDNIKKIEQYAFNSCTKLNTIDIADSVTSIKFNVFDNTKYYNTSTNWKNNVLYIGNYLIKAKTAISGSYSLKNGTTLIADSAFYGCNSLRSILIPNTLKIIQEMAFKNCTSLSSISIPDSVTSIEKEAFLNTQYYNNSANWRNNVLYINNHIIKAKTAISGSFTTMATTKTIAEEAFDGCTSLTGITLYDNLVTIGSAAFQNCMKLTSMTIPDTVTTIGSYAFSGCDSIEDLIIGNSVEIIDYMAFYYCTSLKSLTIPESVNFIGDSIISHCSSLVSLEVPFIGESPDKTNYFSYLFGGSSSSDNKNLVPQSLETVIISDKAISLRGYTFYNCSYIKNIEIGDNVEKIGSYTFYGCKALENIRIGDSVNSIGEYAFYNCSSLKSVDITDLENWCEVEFTGAYGYNYNNPLQFAKNLYLNDTLVTDLIIPDGVTVISDYTFYNCTSLTSITVPPSLKSVGGSAFSGCTNFTDVYITDISAWCNIDFQGSLGAEKLYFNNVLITDLIIPDGVTSIGNYAFYGLTSLENVTIPNSVTSIGNSAFYGCSNMASIRMPDYVDNIGASVFGGTAYYKNSANWQDNVLYINKNLIAAKTTISGAYTIKSGTKTIAASAFAGCNKLTAITIPESIVSIGASAFYNYNTPNLAKVNITDIAAWCNIDFGSYSANPISYTKNLYLNDTLVTDLIVPDGVTSIGDYAFYNCDSITSITIPNNVTTIGDFAFYGCSAIINIMIPDGVTSIGEEAFEYCESLTSITLPDSVTKIGKLAFSNTGYYSDTANRENNILYIGNHLIKAFIPSTVTNVAIKNNIITIADEAFLNASSIENLIVNKNVKNIGKSAFENCSKIVCVYYYGTKSDWNKINISSGNDVFSSVDFYYSYKGLPTATIKCDNNLASEQTVTFSFFDLEGIAGYYWGKNSNYNNNTYTSSTKSTVTKTVYSEGTYYLTVKDTDGNLSETISATFVTTTFDANGGIIGISSVLTKAGDTFTAPIPTRYGYEYISWGTSDTAKEGVTEITPTENNTYYAIWKDIQKPILAIRSLNKVDSIQTAFLDLEDNESVLGYYWGTDSIYNNNICKIFIEPEPFPTAIEEVTAPGTYYLTGFDTSGNLSETVSATFYKTTFDANGGSVAIDSVLTKSGDRFTAPIPERENYKFLYWGTSTLATTGYTTITPTMNRTYYAIWEYIDTTKPIGSIRSTNNDASSQTVTFTLSDDVKVAGYYWGKYIDYKNNSYTATSSSTATKTVSVEGTYYLTVEDTSGNLSETVSVTFYKTTLDCKGGTARLSYLLTMSGNTSTLPTPTRDGYEFVGWTESENSGIYVETVTPTENTTYYAIWKDTTKPTATISSTNDVEQHQTVTLTFTDNEGIAGYYWGTSNYYISNNFVSTSKKTVNLTIFVSGTYYLTVKDKSGNISETVSVTFYKTTLDARGGYVYPDTIITMEGNSFTLPTPERYGYEFDEWSGPSCDTQGNMNFTPQRDTLLYAFWIDKTKPTGRIESTNDLAQTQTVTLYISDNETIDGYYWGTEHYYSNNRFVSGAIGEYEITEPGTYYLTVRDKNLNLSDTVSATFYQTTLDATGGTVDVDTVLTMSGNLFATPVPERDGYYFLGWSRYPNDSVGVKSITPDGNHTYYAIWQDITNPIGSISSTNDVAPTQTVTLTLSDDAGIAGYYWGKETYYPDNEYFVTNEETVTFTLSEQGTYYLTVVDVNGNVSETLYQTFYKTWFDAHGGDISIDSVLTLEGNSFIAPIPEKENYIFDGWVLYDETEDGIFEITPRSNDTYFAKWKLEKPDSPQNLTATLYGYDDVALSWDAVEGANRYHVSYKKSSESNYTKSYIVIGTSYKFPNLADNTNYDFMVTAIADDAGEMISSDPATITLKTSCPLGKVSTFTATLYGHDDVELNWKAVPGATGYKVYYKKASAKNYTLKATTPALTYSIADLTDNCKYNFKIVPVANYTLSSTTGTAKAITYSTTKDLAAPKTLKASLYGYDDAKLTWSAVSGASRYKIYYKQSSDETYKYKTYTTKTTYNFANLYDGVSYDFKIVPCSYVNSTHFEADSFKTVTISSTINISAPTTFKAELYGYDDVELSWSAVKNAVAYKVYYKKSTAKSYTLKTTTTELTTKIWNLSDGIKYDFKVVPCTYVNGSYFADDNAKTASLYTLKKISTPTVTKHKAGKVKITWGNIQGETGYEISRSLSKTGTYIVSDYKTTTAKAKIVSATKGKTYYYKVRAYKIVDGQKIYSPWSAVKAYKLK